MARPESDICPFDSLNPLSRSLSTPVLLLNLARSPGDYLRPGTPKSSSCGHNKTPKNFAHCRKVRRIPDRKWRDALWHHTRGSLSRQERRPNSAETWLIIATDG